MVYGLMAALLVIGYFFCWVLYVEALYFWGRLTRRLNRGKVRCDACGKCLRVWHPQVDINAYFDTVLVTYTFHNKCARFWYDELDRRFERLEHRLYHAL